MARARRGSVEGGAKGRLKALNASFAAHVDDEDYEPLPLLLKLPYAPWSTQRAENNVKFYRSPISGVSCEDVDSVRRDANIALLTKIGKADYIAISDGSVGMPQDAEGKFLPPVRATCACTIRRNSLDEPVYDHGSLSAGRYACSYSAEIAGIRLALKLLRKSLINNYAIPGTRAVLLLDGQGPIAALEKGPLLQTEYAEAQIWRDIIDLVHDTGCRIAFGFIFAHCDWAPHEAVDSMAKQALHLPIEKVPVWWRDASRIRINEARHAHDVGLAAAGFYGRWRQTTSKQDEHAAPDAPKEAFPTVPPRDCTFKQWKFIAQAMAGASSLAGAASYHSAVETTCRLCHRANLHRGLMVEHVFNCTDRRAVELRSRIPPTLPMDPTLLWVNRVAAQDLLIGWFILCSGTGAEDLLLSA